jgi:hypothetical protein
MPDDREVWTTAFYHLALRKKIGEEISRDYDLSQLLPDRIRTLLNQLDESNLQDSAVDEGP